MNWVVTNRGLSFPHATRLLQKKLNKRNDVASVENVAEELLFLTLPLIFCMIWR